MMPLHYLRSQGHEKVDIISWYDGLQVHEHAVRLKRLTHLQATNIGSYSSVG
jgi:hypothetical protein